MSAGSGKMALGPWTGPFATHPEAAALPPTLYMDNRGVMWTSLDAVAQDAKRAVIAAAIQQQRANLALALATAQNARRGDDAALAKRVKEVQCMPVNKYEATRGARARHMMRVMQPR